MIPELGEYNINQENSFIIHCVKCQTPGVPGRVTLL